MYIVDEANRSVAFGEARPDVRYAYAGERAETFIRMQNCSLEGNHLKSKIYGGRRGFYI